jgi:L-lysine 6-transaminase
MLAFDLPNREQRDQFHAGLFELGLLALRCGERSIRFRPVLDISMGVCQQALALLREQCQRTRSAVRTA